LQAAGVLCIEAMPAHRGDDKMMRTIAVSDMFSTGTIWAPKKWPGSRAA
jgi:hypothetical protein